MIHFSLFSIIPNSSFYFSNYSLNSTKKVITSVFQTQRFINAFSFIDMDKDLSFVFQYPATSGMMECRSSSNEVHLELRSSS